MDWIKNNRIVAFIIFVLFLTIWLTIIHGVFFTVVIPVISFLLFRFLFSILSSFLEIWRFILRKSGGKVAGLCISIFALDTILRKSISRKYDSVTGTYRYYPTVIYSSGSGYSGSFGGFGGGGFGGGGFGGGGAGGSW